MLHQKSVQPIVVLPYSVVYGRYLYLLYYSNWITTAKLSLTIFDDKTNEKVSSYFIFPQERFWLSFLVSFLHMSTIFICMYSSLSKSIHVRIMTFSILVYTVRTIGWDPLWRSILIYIHLYFYISLKNSWKRKRSIKNNFTSWRPDKKTRLKCSIRNMTSIRQ